MREGSGETPSALSHFPQYYSKLTEFERSHNPRARSFPIGLQHQQRHRADSSEGPKEGLNYSLMMRGYSFNSGTVQRSSEWAYNSVVVGSSPDVRWKN